MIAAELSVNLPLWQLSSSAALEWTKLEFALYLGILR